VLTVGVGDVPSPAARLAALVAVVAGALTAAAASLLLGRLPGPHRWATPELGDDAAPRATAAQKRARWQRTLTHRAGWQYALRLATCLAVAGLARRLWPDHHLHWIAVTVAILTERRIERCPPPRRQSRRGPHPPSRCARSRPRSAPWARSPASSSRACSSPTARRSGAS
jgi:hypothetical protein